MADEMRNTEFTFDDPIEHLPPEPEPPELPQFPDVCDICGGRFKGSHGVTMHKARTHRGMSRPTESFFPFLDISSCMLERSISADF